MAFSQKIVDLKKEVLAESQELFAHVDAIAEENTLKVLDAMRECKVSDAHFNTTSGYAYDDIGRSKLEELYANIFGAERALVRTQFVSGTHALATVLFGILRPGDELVSLTGKPYDTMQTVIGYDNPSPGSLKEFGVLYNELSMIDGKVDMDGIKNVITDKTKMVEIQRSRGYSMRNPLSIEDIKAICAEVHRLKPDCICFVDNCYGEFVDTLEPTQVGADIMAGSLIKNPGGGIAPTGGYVVGRNDLVELTSYRLTAPGMGDELGASLSNNRLLFQGLFLAPHVVAQSIKASIVLWQKKQGGVTPEKYFWEIYFSGRPIKASLRLSGLPYLNKYAIVGLSNMKELWYGDRAEDQVFPHEKRHEHEVSRGKGGLWRSDGRFAHSAVRDGAACAQGRAHGEARGLPGRFS